MAAMDIDDPLLLFTPQKGPRKVPQKPSPGDRSSSEESIPRVIKAPSSKRAPRTEAQRLVFSHVSVPSLDPATRERYKRIAEYEEEEEDPEGGDAVKFVGQRVDKGVNYIFAMYEDGIIRRVSVIAFLFLYMKNMTI